jgi:hypothetical protein
MGAMSDLHIEITEFVERVIMMGLAGPADDLQLTGLTDMTLEAFSEGCGRPARCSAATGDPCEWCAGLIEMVAGTAARYVAEGRPIFHHGRPGNGKPLRTYYLTIDLAHPEDVLDPHEFATWVQGALLHQAAGAVDVTVFTNADDLALNEQEGQPDEPGPAPYPPQTGPTGYTADDLLYWLRNGDDGEPFLQPAGIAAGDPNVTATVINDPRNGPAQAGVVVVAPDGFVLIAPLDELGEIVWEDWQVLLDTLDPRGG